MTQDRCIYCGEPGALREITPSGSEDTGLVHALCIFENSYGTIGIYQNYPQNLKEHVFRYLIRKNIPANPNLINKVYFRVIYTLILLFTIFVACFLLYFNLFQTRIIFILYTVVAAILSFVVFLVENTDTKFWRTVTDPFSSFRMGEEFFINTSFVAYYGHVFTRGVIAGLLVPLYLEIIVIFGIFTSLLATVMMTIIYTIFGIFYPLAILFNPVGTLKTLYRWVVMKPLQFTKRRVSNFIHTIINGFQLNSNLHWSARATFDNSWESGKQPLKSTGIYALVIMLYNLPITFFSIFVSMMYPFGTWFLSLVSSTLQVILAMVNISVQSDILVVPVLEVILNTFVPILVFLLTQKGMEYVNESVWKRYGKIIISGPLPPVVEQEKIGKNQLVRPIPPQLVTTGYNYQYWRSFS